MKLELDITGTNLTAAKEAFEVRLEAKIATLGENPTATEVRNVIKAHLERYLKTYIQAVVLDYQQQQAIENATIDIKPLEL